MYTGFVLFCFVLYATYKMRCDVFHGLPAQPTAQEESQAGEQGPQHSLVKRANKRHRTAGEHRTTGEQVRFEVNLELLVDVGTPPSAAFLQTDMVSEIAHAALLEKQRQR